MNDNHAVKSTDIANQTSAHMKELLVNLGDRSYPIYIGEGILNDVAALFQKHGITVKSHLLIVTDEHVARHYLAPLKSSLEHAGYRVAEAVVQSGEKSKSLQVLEEVTTVALEAGLDRNAAVIALGGGVVGDLAGFVAASYMRGVRFVQIPTTILAHDSSVGGKVAVNHRLAKNIIGSFHQPVMVLYDTSTLATLPMREVRAGLSEVIKHGLIWDVDFVDWLEEHAEQLLSLDMEALQYALYRGCQVKTYVVSQDEREGGLRAILNLGHTVGHALEAVSSYDELLHGEAISIGMAVAARVAIQFGAPTEVYERTERLLGKYGLPTRLPAHMSVEAIISAMMHDKKFKDGQIIYIVPEQIGKVVIRNDVAVDQIIQVLEQLKEEE